MIKVWGRESSSNVQAVMWCIAELDLPFHRVDAGFIYGVVTTDIYLALNPNGTVPTIKDGAHPPLYESGAIIRYLAKQYGDENFWPSDAQANALVDQWAEWSKINVAGKFTTAVFWQAVRIPKERQNADVITDGINTFEKYLSIADEQLASNAYLAGKHFTPADIQFGHVLYRYFNMDIPRIELHNVAAYYDRLQKRPAFRKHVMVSYEELVDSM